LIWTIAVVSWVFAAAAQRRSASMSRSSSTTTLRGSPSDRWSIMTLPVISMPAPPAAQRA